MSTPTTWFEFCEMILMDPERAKTVLSDPRSIAEMTTLVKSVGKDVDRASTFAQEATEIQQVKEHMDAVLAADFVDFNSNANEFINDYASKPWLCKNKVAKQLYDKVELYRTLVDSTLQQMHIDTIKSLDNVYHFLHFLIQNLTSINKVCN